MRGRLPLFDTLGGSVVGEFHGVNKVEMVLNACEAVLYASVQSFTGPSDIMGPSDKPHFQLLPHIPGSYLYLKSNKHPPSPFV